MVGGPVRGESGLTDAGGSETEMEESRTRVESQSPLEDFPTDEETSFGSLSRVK